MHGAAVGGFAALIVVTILLQNVGDVEVILSRDSDVFWAFYSLQIIHSTWCWTREV